MHALFTDWYRVADPKASSETITKRWTATEELLASITTPEMLELAAFVVRPSAQHPTWLQAAYKAQDDVMATRNIDEELRILSGALLRLAVESDPDEGSNTDLAAALSLLVGVFGMPDPPLWLREHIEAAAEALNTAGRHDHAAFSASTLTDPLTAAAVQKTFAQARRAIDEVAEINSYLWWTFTRYSAVLSGPYDAHQLQIVAFAAPFDLFRLVRRSPLAPECETLLLYALGHHRSADTPDVSFKNYITALSRQQAQLFHAPLPAGCSDLCSLMWAVDATVAGRAWQVEFEKRFGFRTAAKFSPGAVAIEFLRELLLLKIVGE